MNNNSRTERRSVRKFGRKVAHLRCDSHTSFKVNSLQVRVARSINADTSCAMFANGKVYELQTVYGWRTMNRISHRRDDLQSERSRSQGHAVQSMLYICHYRPVATPLAERAV